MKVAPRLVVVLVALASMAVSAFDVDEARARYTVTSWTEKDGMPTSYVRSIAQDAAGYLWLATYTGLVRFDGERFITWTARDGSTLPSDDLSSLLVARDGSLWVGGFGSVTHIVDGLIDQHGSSADGFFSGSITDLLQDQGGAIWAAAQSGLGRFDGTKWERIGASYGLPERGTGRLHQDRTGTIWVGASLGLHQQNLARTAFNIVPTLTYSIEDIAEDSAGIIVAHPTSLFARIDGKTISLRDPNLSRSHGTRLLHDSEGSLWIGTRGHGLVRVRANDDPSVPVVDRVTTQDGLSANSVLALFEDRERNLWVGTPVGLNRLSKNAIIPVPLGEGMTGHVRAVTSEETGTWVATEESLLHFSGNKQTDYDWRRRLPNRTLTAIHHDRRSQTLWISTNRGLVRLARGELAPFALPGGLALNRIRSMATDTEGRLWLCDVDKGVFRSRDSTLSAFDLITDHKPASSVLAGRDGRVWIGFVDGTVGSYNGGQLRTFSENEGLPSGGAVTAIHEDAGGTVWVGTHRGLSRYTSGAFVTLTKGQGFPGPGPVSIADDAEGNLWLGVTGMGMLYVNPKEFDLAVNDRTHVMEYQLYDPSDGMRGTPVPSFGTPTAARAADGSIWFLTGNGLAVVDPARLREPPPAAPLVIENVLANEQRYDPVAGLSLPPHTSALEIDYTFLSLAPLSQVSFRYMLEGFDQHWIEAGTRRQAFYTSVPPGSYRFVVETGGNGPSAASAAEWRFSIQPGFYQTTWFALAGAVTAGFGLWGLWRLRLYQVRRRFAMILDERTRMAREIHDTLLQGLVGVAVQFKVISEHVHSSPDAARERLERLRKLVEHYICETRQSIWDLRSPALETNDLVTALKQAGEAITADKNVRFELAVRGKPYPCAPKVEEQLLRVCREGLSNAVRHAHPSMVRVEITYDRDTVRLRVVDNGSGFSPDDPAFEDGTHWGLMSMRERAQQINAKFQLASAPGKGTELELIVPALANSQLDSRA